MDNLDDLKAIWLTAKTDILPSADEMIRIIKKFRNQKIRNKILLIISAFLSSALMVAVMFIYKSTMLSTRTGEIMLIMACYILAYTNLKSIKRFYSLNDDYNNHEFILFLERTRQNQIYFYKKTQVVALLLSSAGLLLYLYEPVCGHVLAFAIVYTTTIVYLLFMWFYIRPRTFKREAKKLNAMVEQLERISKQF
jgi:glucose-6-phosphate-specific signal transduction histidine kinase